MKTSRDWEKPIRRLEQLMRLKSFPVAFKMLENKEDLDKIPFMRRLEDKKTMCQLITLVRNFDWTVGAVAEDFLGPYLSECHRACGYTPALQRWDVSEHCVGEVAAGRQTIRGGYPSHPVGEVRGGCHGPTGVQSIRSRHGAHLRESGADDASHQFSPE